LRLLLSLSLSAFGWLASFARCPRWTLLLLGFSLSRWCRLFFVASSREFSREDKNYTKECSIKYAVYPQFCAEKAETKKSIDPNKAAATTTGR